MDVRTFTVGPVAENCYIVRRDGSDRALIADPGDEADKLLGAIDELGPILAAAKLEMPQAIDAQAVPAELERTTKQATATYDAAAALFLEVSDGATDAMSAKNAARVGRIFSLYGKVMLARATGQADAAAAALAEATAARCRVKGGQHHQHGGGRRVSRMEQDHRGDQRAARERRARGAPGPAQQA